MRNVVANPSQAPFVTGCFVFALATALFAFIVQKRAMAARMWPRAPGRIESSGVHEFQARNSSYQMLTRWSTRFRTAIRYSYMVGRVRYTGDKITLGGQFSATTDAFARRGASRYAQGSTVEVYYNPQNPAECVLQPRAAGLWLVWLAALALLVLAFVIAR